MKLRLFPDPVLRQTCHPVINFSDSKVQKTIHALRHLIATEKHGIGAAAPQIGVPLKIAVLDLRSRNPEARETVLINPSILEAQQPLIYQEGCMSIPDYKAHVERYEMIVLRWQDLTEVWKERRLVGIEAICAQHELDHLEGRLFIDRVVSLKRDMIPRKRL